MKTAEVKELSRLVTAARHVVVAGADHLDGDSLSSLLAFEEILGDLNKQVTLFSTGRVEPYLKYLEGWDRVTDQWPVSFDLAITPDLGAPSSAPRLMETSHTILRSADWVIFDHHRERTSVDGARLELVDPDAASTTELIYLYAKRLKWPLNERACRYLVAGLYADTLNLTTPSVTPRTVKVFAELVERGQLQVSEMHAAFRDIAAFDANLLPLKGQLLQSVEFYADNRIAVVVVPREVLETYRDHVNPSALILPDLLWSRGVEVAAVINDYPNVQRTSLRTRVPIAGAVATQMGGGGHPMAAAFPSEHQPVDAIKQRLVAALETALKEYHASH